MADNKSVKVVGVNVIAMVIYTIIIGMVMYVLVDNVTVLEVKQMI